MSFILDALKKSESERLRKDTPGIASIPETSRQKSSHKWIWLVLALVTVNLVVLAGLMIRVEQSSSSAEAPAEIVNAEVAPVPGPASPVAGIAPDNETDSPRVSDVKPDPAVDEPVEALATTPAVLPDAANPPQFGSVDSGLETFNDLRAKGAFVLPDMHLDIHVYSSNAVDRFVFVNMSKYKEKATLTEGPMVSEITPDGVILSYQGRSFLLPRE